MMPPPSSQFVESVIANLKYWQARAANLSERQFDTLDVDWPNIVRAVQFSLRLLNAQPLATEFALQMFNFVEQRGQWQEWAAILEGLVRNCPPNEQRRRGQLLYQLGNFRRLERRLPEALEAHRQAEALMAEWGEPKDSALMKYALSEDYRYQRSYDEAERWGVAALTGFDQAGLGSSTKTGTTLNTLGLIAYARGDLTTAEDRLTRAVQLWQAEQAPTEMARVLNNLGIVLQAAGNTEAALQTYSQANDLLAQTNSEFDKVMIELSLGTLYFNLGKLSEAEAAFRRADSPFLRQSGHIYYRAMTANNLGNALLAQARIEEAESQLQTSLQLYRQVGDNVMIAILRAGIDRAFVNE